MKKVKNILLDIKLEGKGIVNMDSNEQKWIYNNEEKSLKKARHDNVMYGKKNFYRGEDGKIIDRLKISRDCMMKSIFEQDYISTSPNIQHHDAILYSYIGSVSSLLRGYMFAGKSETLKKKGVVTLCDAEQTKECTAITNLETFSRAQTKTSSDVADVDAEKKGDVTYFMRENVGEVQYSTKGMIDLAGLQFISCDQVLDRYSFNPDKFEIYKSFLSSVLPDQSMRLGYQQFTTSNVMLPEYGMKLSNENIVFLVKEFLVRLLQMNIRRRGAYAKLDTLRIKLVENPMKDTFGNEDGWIEIRGTEDIENLNFDVENFYTSVELEEVKEKRDEIEARLKELKESENKSKKDKKKQKTTHDEQVSEG